MAGFAIVMAFITGGAVLLLVAVIASFMLRVYALRSVPGKSWEARKYHRELIATPFAAVLWIAPCLIAYTWVSNHVAHQSVSFSPDPYITLPNGYVVGSLNTYCGYVHAPGVDTDIPWTGPGYVRGLIDLDYADGRFQGTYLDSHSDMQPLGTDRIRKFIFDTRNRSIQTWDSSIQADFGQQQTMVHEHSSSYWQFYAANRRHWPEPLFWLLLLAGVATIVICAIRMKPDLPLDENN
jgi:hypothetical protein